MLSSGKRHKRCREERRLKNRSCRQNEQVSSISRILPAPREIPYALENDGSRWSGPAPIGVCGSITKPLGIRRNAALCSSANLSGASSMCRGHRSLRFAGLRQFVSERTDLLWACAEIVGRSASCGVGILSGGNPNARTGASKVRACRHEHRESSWPQVAATLLPKCSFLYGRVDGDLEARYRIVGYVLRRMPKEMVRRSLIVWRSIPSAPAS